MSYDASDLCAWAPKPAESKMIKGKRKYWCWAPTCTEALAILNRSGFCEITPGYEMSRGLFIRSRRSAARLHSNREGVKQWVELDMLHRMVEASEGINELLSHVVDTPPESREERQQKVAEIAEATPALAQLSAQLDKARRHLQSERRAREPSFGEIGEKMDLPVKVKCAQCGRVSIISDAS